MATTSQASMVMGNAIGKSDQTMDAALADAIKYLDNSYKEAQAYLTPYRVAGERGLDTLNNFIGANGKQAQQQALAGIVQPAMNAMIGYGPQIAQQAMGMFFGNAGFSPQQSNQMINQSTASAIQSIKSPTLQQVRDQYKVMTDKSSSDEQRTAATKWFEDNAVSYAPAGSQSKNGVLSPEVAKDIRSGIDLTANPEGGYRPPTGTASGAGVSDMSQSFNQYMSQYGKLMNQDPAQFSNNLISTLMDPVTGAVTKATQGFTDSMMKYGVQAIDASAASKGMLNSGRTITQAQDYGMGVAGQYIIPAIQNVLGMGVTAGTNQANQIMQGGTALSGQQTSLANQYMSSMSQSGTQLAASSISSTQNALANLLNNATGAATTGAGLAGQQGTTGSGYNMQTGQYKADNALLRGKVESDALNTIGQLQFLQDMGPYINQLGPIPGISSGGGTAGSSNAMAQHNAVDEQAQNYLRAGNGSTSSGRSPLYGNGTAYGSSYVSGVNSQGQSYMGAG